MLSSASPNRTIFARCFLFFVLFHPIVQNGYCNNSLESLIETSETLENRFERLEKLLSDRLSELRELIVRSMTKSDNNFPETNEAEAMRTKVAYAKRNRLRESLIDVGENEFEHGNANNLGIFVRQLEIDRYNDTVHEEKQRKVYTFYWRVSNLSEKLSKWETGRSERSSSFYVADAGYSMYLRFTPKYFPDGTIFISVGLTAGFNDSKILWPFPLPVRIEILDLTPRMNDSPKDRSSRLWDPATVCSSYFWGRPRRRITEDESPDNPECVGLSVPRQLLTTSNNKRTNFFPSHFLPTRSTGKYISNDSLFVKLTVYL
ncbi:uncharacterized protein [Venturia canescens]|uniref:uncharacterized protein isoform X2 n=1 Tax=Venturia canescens TaxID=32260 RepID=UPI001C9C7934|nr:uncharacterized protein LOC122415581 isoform X2 [Venturia canescens]